MICLLGSSMAEAGEPKRWAILIGIDNYFDLTPLTSSSKDAIQFGEILEERCGFNPKNVSVVVDQPKQHNRKAMLDVRYEPLRMRLQNFVSAAEKERVQTLVVYYSGHGCALLDSDAQNADLLLPAIDASESNGVLANALSKNEIQGMLAQANIPEKLLILDCCHAAQPDQIPLAGKAIRLGSVKREPSQAKSGDATSANKINTNSSFVVLAGSGFHQIAGEQVFTKHLVNGLSVLGNTASDIDSSQQIEIDELFSHVRGAMSAGGGQTPSMEVISGNPDRITLAPVVARPDPTRTARVYVVTADQNLIPEASVKLVFSDNDRGEPTTLASSQTNQSGKATLNYRFGTTRERNGRFQISVTHRGGQYASVITSIEDFANRASPADFIISLSRRIEEFQPTPANSSEGTSPNFPKAFSEPTHHEVITSIGEYIEKNSEVPDLCSFEKHFSEYHALMKTLKRTDKCRASGITICFPSTEYWQQNDAFRAEVLRVLTARGVIDPALLATRRTSSFLNMKEPSYNEVKKAAFGIVEKMNADVCGLVDYVDGYRALINTLDKSEKYEVLPGLTVCFPSKESWDTKPSFRRKFVRVLREAFVLTK